ncbi:isoprenoid synthase domain-containing protein [Amanita rubescens]|nr:isoprenoid synthase domain-containing protein [Amanita rubescens]
MFLLAVAALLVLSAIIARALVIITSPTAPPLIRWSARNVLRKEKRREVHHTGTKKEIKDGITYLFRRCNASMKRLSVDEELHNATCEKLLQLGYPIHDPATRKAIEPYLKIANYYTSGTHLNTKDMPVRTCISAIIAIMSYLDDLFSDEPGPVCDFNNRLVHGVPQEHPVLTVFSRLLSELPKYWDPVMADMMRSSAMSFITSIMIEYKMRNGNLPNSLNLAKSLRDMSGFSMLCCLWMFPTNTPPEIFLAGLSTMVQFMNLGNDILSFYKEELAGETTNYISVCARTHKTNKLDEFKQAVNDAVDTYRQLEQLASTYPNVYGQHLDNWSGYIRFHFTHPRYRLVELLGNEVYA